MAKPIISADSHITEPPETYIDRIDGKFRDRAPHVVHDRERGDLFVIEGLAKPIPMGLVAAAGKPAESLTRHGARSRNFASIRSTYVFGGSVMCESAEMIGCAVMQLALLGADGPAAARRRRRRRDRPCG